MVEFLDQVITGDAAKVLREIPDAVVDCVLTGPPYLGWDFGHGGIGPETTVEQFLQRLQEVFAECHRVLKPTGTCFVNIGDSYNGRKRTDQPNLDGGWEYKNKSVGVSDEQLPIKSLCLVPERFAVRMVEHGWLARNCIIWAKDDHRPENVHDRFTNNHDYIRFFTKSERYYFNKLNVTTPSGMRNMPTVWHTDTMQVNEPGSGRFPTLPLDFHAVLLRAGCPPGGVVLDPFLGWGTTACVAVALGYHYIGIEINPETAEIARMRLEEVKL